MKIRANWIFTWSLATVIFMVSGCGKTEPKPAETTPTPAETPKFET